MARAPLLHMAEAADADDFLRLAAVLAQSRETQRLRDSLQENLRIAAGNQPFEAFLASFEEEDHDAQESRCAALNAELRDIREQEERLSDEVGRPHGPRQRPYRHGHAGPPAATGSPFPREHAPSGHAVERPGPCP